MTITFEIKRAFRGDESFPQFSSMVGELQTLADKYEFGLTQKPDFDSNDPL